MKNELECKLKIPNDDYSEKSDLNRNKFHHLDLFLVSSTKEKNNQEAHQPFPFFLSFFFPLKL